MISANSRYSNLPVFTSRKPNTAQPTYDVWRPLSAQVDETQTYRRHVWRQGDRLDYLAAVTLGSPSLMHRILDLNPAIQDPFHIEPGTMIRVPIRKISPR